MKRRVTIILLALLVGILPIFLNGSPVKADHDLDPNLDPSLVYLEIRATLKEAIITARGSPAQVEIGVFKGWILPIWSDPANLHEELYFSICVPTRWNGDSDIVVHVYTALSAANEKANAYQIELSWEKATPDAEAIPATDHDVYLVRSPLNDTQYFLYRDSFVIDYDIHVGNILQHDDEIAFRLRRIAAGGSYTELDGDVIIIHAGVLFARGDLLDNPPDMDDYITEAEMEEVGIQFGAFNTILVSWTNIFLIFLGLIFILGLSYLAFWRWNALLFMLVAGASSIFGFTWHHVFPGNLGLTLGIIAVAYALICVAFAFRCIFWQERHDTKDVVSD